MSLNLTLVGYGNAGRIFHAPLINGVPGLRLASIVSSRADAVQHDWPQVPVRPTLQQALAEDAIDVVVIASPNDSHAPLATQALLAGKHVVVDKPCSVTLAQTSELLHLAQAQGRVLTVFQNRRLDSDFLSLQQVLAQGLLGRLVEVNSHFDRYRPVLPMRWREQDRPGAGLWLDLGAHLVDQALVLWGPPAALSVDWAALRDGAVVNDWFHAVLRYPDTGLRVILHASTLVAEPGPRWAVHGTQGTLLLHGLDTQEDALKAGARVQCNDPDWGHPAQPGSVLQMRRLPGVTSPVAVRTEAPTAAGNYFAWYANLRDHLRGQAALIVSPEQVYATMRLLSLGEQSARQHGAWVSW